MSPHKGRGYHNGDMDEGVKVNKDILKTYNFFKKNFVFLPPTPYFFKCVGFC